MNEQKPDALDEAIRRAAEAWFNDTDYDNSPNGLTAFLRERFGPVMAAEAACRDLTDQLATARNKYADSHAALESTMAQLAAVREEYADYRKQQEAWHEEAYRQIAEAKAEAERWQAEFATAMSVAAEAEAAKDVREKRSSIKMTPGRNEQGLDGYVVELAAREKGGAK